MKINENVKIVGRNVELVPYNAEHVEKYHAWMDDEEILRLTGSERLTLEQEYDMQKSWREDEDKLTFIVLDRSKIDSGCDEITSMAGDVNLFINWEDREAETEVMIADPTARGKGFGSEAVQLIMAYAVKNLKILRFIARIVDDNVASLSLFEKKLKFERVSHSEVFKEYTLRFPESLVDSLSSLLDSVMVSNYRP